MEAPNKKMTIKKWIYIIVGCIGLALGAVGAVMPLMPAFPFLLLAAFCFGRSSERLDAWFKNSKLYRDNLADYVKGEGMPRAAKIRVMLLVTALFTFGFIMMRAVPVGRIVLLIIWAFHIWYFALRVKTKVAAPEES